MFYHGFTLSRYRSLGFGSNNANIVALFGLAFAMASSPPFERRLNRACTINSPDHSSTGTTSGIPSCDGIALRLLVNIRFQVLFTPRQGYFSPFPRGTCSLSVVREYLALEGGPPDFLPGFTCPTVLWPLPQVQHLSLTGLSPSVIGRSRPFS